MTVNALQRLVAQTEQLAKGFESLPLNLVRASAKVVEASITHAIKTDAPRQRVAGGRVGVRDTTIRTGSNPAVLVRASGPLHLLANPTAPHPIASKHPGPMRTPYGPRYTVQHPGTRGKDTWRRGVDEARPLISKAVQEAATAEISKVFR